MKGIFGIISVLPECLQQGLAMDKTSFLADLLSAAGDAAYDWDLGADHIEWFGAFNRIFGEIRTPPANSKDFYSSIHDDDRHLIFGAEVRVIDRDYRVRRMDGRIVPVHEHGVAVFEGDRLVRQYGML